MAGKPSAAGGAEMAAFAELPEVSRQLAALRKRILDDPRNFQPTREEDERFQFLEQRERELAPAAARALASAECAGEAKTKFLRELPEPWDMAVHAEFAKVFRELARNPHVEAWAGAAVDLCGTGGDHSGSFNISTAAAFVVAAGKTPVFKHGNRASTSKSGSADFLEKLGFPLEAADATWRSALREVQFAFFFAPAYHPAFRHVAEARKALAAEGRRTIFNTLGPVLNPGRPKHQLVGVPSVLWMQFFAASLEELGIARGLVVHGHVAGRTPEGLDELSTVYPNVACGVGELRFIENETLDVRPAPPSEAFPRWRRDVPTLDIQRIGLASADASVLAGGDAAQNVEILEALLDNRAPDGLRDTVCLNAGAALWVAGRAEDLREGVRQALALVQGGEVKQWLAKARAFFQDVKG